MTLVEIVLEDNQLKVAQNAMIYETIATVQINGERQRARCRIFNQTIYLQETENHDRDLRSDVP